MAKKDKQNKELQVIETKGELMTINSDNTITEGEPTIEETIIEQPKKEEPSVFLQPETKEEVKEETSVFLQTEEKSNEAVPLIEESTTTPQAEKIKSAFAAVAKPKVVKKNLIYQVTWYDEKKTEFTYFTNKVPKIIIDNIILEDCFKKYHLEENILNKKVIKVNYKGKDKVIELKLDLSIGLILKVVEETGWMIVEQDRAEKMFHQRVLEEYRNIGKTLVGDNNNTELEQF